MTEFELTISILMAIAVGVWTVLLYKIWSVIGELIVQTTFWLGEIARRS